MERERGGRKREREVKHGEERERERRRGEREAGFPQHPA